MGRLSLGVCVLKVRDTSVELDGHRDLVPSYGVQEQVIMYFLFKSSCQLNPTTNGSVVT